MELSGLQIFKYLPAAKKAENSNCKKCGCPTCMAYALKLAKGTVSIDMCPHVSSEFRELFEHSKKLAQKTVGINNLKIGGENVLFRHEKTFINKTALCVLLDCSSPDFEKQLKRVQNFEISILNNSRKVDLIVLKNSNRRDIANSISYEEFKKLPIAIVEDEDFPTTARNLKFIREKAIKEKDEKYSNPVCVHFPAIDSISLNTDMAEIENLGKLCAKAAFYICKYANMLLFETFNEEMFASLLILRENIYTDPQKPLKVEPKIYEFNEVDENSLIFLTTNFALTFFAVANELENLNCSSYLIVTPADGMSVLTAWSAEKFTAKMVAQTLIKYDLASRVKNRKIIIPGLLAHMKGELESEIKSSGLDFEIVIGTVDACEIADFVKNCNMA